MSRYAYARGYEYRDTEYQPSVFCALALRWLMNRSEACNKLLL